MWDDDGGAGEIGNWNLGFGNWSLEFGNGQFGAISMFQVGHVRFCDEQ